MSIFVGCAGWNVPRASAERFPIAGTHLARYAACLNAVEINSSFYRSHRVSTYERWAASTPDEFRFAVKIPKQITHVNRLIDVEFQVENFCREVSGLGSKLGALLVQLPPSLPFEERSAGQFFRGLRSQVSGPIFCEPRHLTWFTADAESSMIAEAVGRVAADPALVPAAALPAGHKSDCYFRWHGSPRMYYSTYGDDALSELACRVNMLANDGKQVWCIFDNTALGAATMNALALRDLLLGAPTVSSRR